MTRRLLNAIVLVTIVSLVTIGQEKPVPPSKPQPEIRTAMPAPSDTNLKASGQDNTNKSPQGLPKFDVQQFVITGVASMDLPDVEKLESSVPPRTIELVSPTDALRDRATFEFIADEKKGITRESQFVYSGRVQASVGTFLTSRFGFLLSLKDRGNFLTGNFRYGSSRAYVPFANHSGGSISVTGGMTLRGPSEWSDGGMLNGGLDYGSETYRFHGSATPSLTRTVSRFNIAATYGSPRELVYTYGMQGGMSVTSISDSTRTINETQLDVGMESNLLVGVVPVDGSIRLALNSISGSGSGTLPYLEARVKTARLWFGALFVQGSGNFILTQGMLGQKLVRLYPQGEIGFRVLENTLVSVSYLGRVQFHSLSKLIQLHPYLAATSTIRQSEVPVDVLARVQTEWSEAWRSSLSARYQSIKDFPLFTEGGRKGLWTTVYLGTTNVLTVQADLFAKFTANSYFTLSFEANSSKNSSTQWRVPYIPDFRLNAGLSFEPARGLRVFPVLGIVDRRVTDILAADKMKAYVVLGLRGEYLALRAFDVFVDVQNLTNTMYDEWNGYRATPFVASLGITYRW